MDSMIKRYDKKIGPSIALPVGTATVLSVKPSRRSTSQFGRLEVWVYHDPEFRHPVRLVLKKTNSKMRGLPGRFIDTVLDGGREWHVFEVV